MGAFAQPFARILRTFAAALGRHEAAGPSFAAISINGTFNDATGWVLGTSCTVDSGSLRANNNTANVNNDHSITQQSAGTYRVQYDVVSQNQGNIIPQLLTTGVTVSGTTNFNPITPGTFSTDIVSPDPVTGLRMRFTRSNNLMDVRVDNITITRIA